jgi:IS30 family transposase
LIGKLKRAHKQRKKKGLCRKVKKTKIPNRVSIDDRPAEVAKRCEPGHWESDSIVSRASKAALNSCVERTSRLLYLTKLPRKTAVATSKTLIRRLARLPPAVRKTITFDNGTENMDHTVVSEKTGIACYFAHPYHSWERGTNENTNGLVRYYLPKKTDFAKVSDQQVAWIEHRLNSRPRKCLGFLTPFEVAASLGVALRG